MYLLLAPLQALETRLEDPTRFPSHLNKSPTHVLERPRQAPLLFTSMLETQKQAPLLVILLYMLKSLISLESQRLMWF
jgi:hypothetical protein